MKNVLVILASTVFSITVATAQGTTTENYKGNEQSASSQAEVQESSWLTQFSSFLFGILVPKDEKVTNQNTSKEGSTSSGQNTQGPRDERVGTIPAN